MARSELSALEKIKDEKGKPIKKSNRPVQPLNERKIYTYKRG
jgi:carbonic anhydrase